MLRESKAGGQSLPESQGWLPGGRDVSSEKLNRQGWVVGKTVVGKNLTLL